MPTWDSPVSQEKMEHTSIYGQTSKGKCLGKWCHRQGAGCQLTAWSPFKASSPWLLCNVWYPKSNRTIAKAASEERFLPESFEKYFVWFAEEKISWPHENPVTSYKISEYMWNCWTKDVCIKGHVTLVYAEQLTWLASIYLVKSLNILSLNPSWSLSNIWREKKKIMIGIPEMLTRRERHTDFDLVLWPPKSNLEIVHSQ